MSLNKESLALGFVAFVHWCFGEGSYLSRELRGPNSLEKALSKRAPTILFYVLTAIFIVLTVAMVCIALDENVAGWFWHHVFSQGWYQSLQDWWQK